MNSQYKTDLQLDGLVHDLNNVFQTIIDAAELIGSDPNWTTVSAIVLRSVDQGRGIVGSIADSGRCDIELAPMLERSIAFTQDFVAAIKRPPIDFNCRLEPGLFLRNKAFGMERVLVNLFINASQAAEPNQDCRVDVQAAVKSGRVEIVVADNGPGIPADLLDSVFSPRFSTDPSHAGLGLHIVRTIVHDAGGMVSAANGAQRGAEFRISLPSARHEARLTLAASAR